MIFIEFFGFSGLRKEQDLYVRLIDSVTKQVRIPSEMIVKVKLDD